MYITRRKAVLAADDKKMEMSIAGKKIDTKCRRKMDTYVPPRDAVERKRRQEACVLPFPSRIGPSLPLDAHRCWFKVKSTTSGNVCSYKGHGGPRDADG
jgi:hypothetical protein